MRDHDLVVIGGGAAGLVAAGMGASLGARTLLIERDRLGGECTWSGCVPSKTLLHEARVIACRGASGEAAWSQIRERIDAVRQSIYENADSPEVIRTYGVETIRGIAHFRDKHTIEIEGVRGVSARRIVIATGSRPIASDWTKDCDSAASIFERERFPRRLLILGAGPASIEFAQAFSRLGSLVTVATEGDRILAHDDRTHADTLQQLLQCTGVEFRFNFQAVAARRVHDRIVVQSATDDLIEADTCLALLGREPNVTSLNLAAAGVIVPLPMIQSQAAPSSLSDVAGDCSAHRC